jgi:RNA polymerase sigma-70 factor (ECF subfamily)
MARDSVSMGGLIGNEEFLTLLTSHQRRIVGYLRTLVPSPADAEEILQEVNLYICRSADEFQLGTDFAAWALRIAHFRVLKWRERQSRERLLFDDTLLERLAIIAHECDRQDTQHLAALEECLGKLPLRELALIKRLYAEPDATPREIAEHAGRSAKGIYTSLKRIRLKLLQCIQRTLSAEDRAS